jgi:formylglycine-generating enzyme required for sulfatase activity/tRNA A-37 threonylcarbamoyl transferase component Bud32
MIFGEGKRLNEGRYEVEKVLGAGGFGVTYCARQTRTEQRVAIKTLNKNHRRVSKNFKKLQERFINEAIALAQCRHPNVVKVYPQGFFQDELWCIVMEYIEGQTLMDHMEEKGTLSEQEAIALAQKLGDALEAVHQQGFLHRDVKPGNILLRNSDLNSPVLIDFGLARAYGEERLHSFSTMSGTLGFAPIEQVEGLQEEYGPWTDIYGLAATLYYLVTDEPPLPSQMRKLVPQEFVPPNEYQSRFSDRFNEGILQGMALEPKERPNSMPEWLELLAPTPQSFAQNQLTTFTFEVVTVNERGRINQRRSGQAQQMVEDLGNGVLLEMVALPGGSFVMGAPEIEEGSSYSERPQHWVEIAPFLMARYPLTQAQYQAIMGKNPSRFSGANNPVENVTWHQAREFCERLSEKTRRKYRLSSEAEWEYACRAGTTTPFSFGETISPELANYNGNYTYGKEPKGKYRKKTTPVGSFPPNAFGLYDMHGNVWEWCEDFWHETYEGVPNDGSAWLTGGNQNLRVLRGGSWFDDPWFCRCANRDGYDPDFGLNFNGFRVVSSVVTTL